MQPIAPAASGHHTPRIFIDDNNFVVLHNVLNILLVEAIRLEQLRDGMDALRFLFKVSLRFCLSIHALLDIARLIGIYFVINLGQIRQHKGILVIRTKKATAFFGQISVVTFFIHRKKQLLFLRVELFFGLVGVQGRLSLVHQTNIIRIFQNP